jgi:hypothetical protein
MMSIDQSSAESTDSAAQPAEEAAQAPAQAASKVASSVGESTKQVAGEAAAQASAVVGQAKDQLRTLIGQTKGEFDNQMASKGEQVASGLRNLVGQLDALASGRTDEAGPLTGYVQEARSKVESFARRLDDGGPQGVLDDLATFARRRPGVFLGGAALLGFIVGRAVRAGAAASRDGLVHAGSSPTDRSPDVAPPMVGELPPPTAGGLVGSTAGAAPVVAGDTTGAGVA